MHEIHSVCNEDIIIRNYYGKNDLTLGDFISNKIANLFEICTICNKKMIEHE